MILAFILVFLIVCIFSLFFVSKHHIVFLRVYGLIISSIVFLLSLIICIDFNFNSVYFDSINFLCVDLNLFNLCLTFGLDGISLFFFVLTSFLIFICVLFTWESLFLKEHLINLLILELLLLLVFSTLDLLLFYIFFEAILIPMFLIIGVLGSRARKIRAAYMLFFYTLFGSLLMLVGLLYIYSTTGTLNLEYLMAYNFSLLEQKLLWLSFFISFASKIPMFPFHIWLPEAHVEAPTVGSVLLAGILLKLGVYGFIRFSLLLFPQASLYFSPLVYFLCIIGLLYASFTAIRQTDIKRIIAYSSIAHMNLVVLGIFSFTIIGLEGSIIQSVNHGFVSGGLFLLVGILYDRYHSRLLYYYSGLVHVMPIYSFFLLIFTFANIAVPGTSSFVGEFMLLVGVYKNNFICCFLSSLGVIICGIYSLWLYNRLIFGNLKIAYTLHFKDLNFREFVILVIMLLPILILGIYPSFLSLGICSSSSFVIF
jgi:proton-translocating NADH-quinone oxidoreductase chain M